MCISAEGVHNTSVDESSVAGLESSLSFEVDEKMKRLPMIKYDQKNVSDTLGKITKLDLISFVLV